jgi:hypothetical protein
MKKHIHTRLHDFLLSESRLSKMNEAYDDISMEQIMAKKKLFEYDNYSDMKTIGDYTYLHFTRQDDWYLWGDVKVFDNSDGTEVANSSYGKPYEHSTLKCTVDVRSDKRRLGIASNMYVWIEELTGEKIYPDTPHSKKAELFWSNPNRQFGEK